MEESSKKKYRRPFLLEAVIVILAIYIAIELSSIIGWSSSAVSAFSSPIDRWISYSIIGLSLLGLYGLMIGSKIGSYLALTSSVFEIVLGSSSALKTMVIPLRLAPILNAIIAIVLGILASVCVFKVGVYPRKASSFIISPSLDSPSVEYILEIVNVTKAYDLGPTRVVAINDLSLKVHKGEVIAIMGPSGSGKSTLLNLIGILDRPSSGHIYIDGVDTLTLDDISLAKLRNEKIGFVFQSYNLINRSKVLRNMELPAMVRGYSRNERLEKARNLLKTVGLEDKMDRKPKTLSGGEQQRVAIARALVNEPKIILADEPTGNIDSRTGHDIMNFLRKMSSENGTTLIVVTHDREVAEMTDRIINIRDGVIISEERLRN